MPEVGWLDAKMVEWDRDPDFILEGVLIEVTERICGLMQQKRISRAELARRVGKSRAYITRLLNGPRNLTLRTVTQLAIALEEGIEVFIPSSLREDRVRAEAEARQNAVLRAQWSQRSLSELLATQEGATLGSHEPGLALAS